MARARRARGARAAQECVAAVQAYAQVLVRRQGVDLILWRHAEAEEGTPDEQRKLTGKGHKQAAKMAAWLSERLARHVTILVSPATRTQQTAKAYSGKFV